MTRFKILLAAIFSSLIIPASLLAQLLCGNANGDSYLSVLDVIYMAEYMFDGGPPPANFDYADFDGREEWTVSDANWLLGCLFFECTDPPQNCPPTGAPIVGVAAEGYRIRHTAYFPAHINHSVIDLALDAPLISSFQFPLQIRVGSTIAKIDSVHFPAHNYGLPYNFNLHSISSSGEAFVLGSIAHLISSNGPVGLARVFINAPLDTSSRTLTVEYADFVPAQAPEGHETPISPFMLGPWNQPFIIPTFVPTCCIVPGDANGDGVTSVSDAVYMINYSFAGGPPPVECLVLGDADGNGIITISDAVFLINYIFAGGPAPACP